MHAPWTTSRPAVDRATTPTAPGPTSWASSTRYASPRAAPAITSASSIRRTRPAVAGIGYVGGKTAMGWDKGSNDLVAAHEWGHNWGRQHAPCGNGRQVRITQYPYAGGAIGDVRIRCGRANAQAVQRSRPHGLLQQRVDQRLHLPGRAELPLRASRCPARVRRGHAALPAGVGAGRRTGSPCSSRPSRSSPGPASPARGRAVPGRRPRRRRLPALRPGLRPRAGGRRSARQRALRLRGAAAARSGGPARRAPPDGARPSGGDAPRRRAAAAVGHAGRAHPRTIAGGKVSLQWDAAAHPMLMVRDPATGQVLSFARGGQAELVTDRTDLDVQLSNGIAGRSDARGGAAVRRGLGLLAAAVLSRRGCARPAADAPGRRCPARARRWCRRERLAGAPALLRHLPGVHGHGRRLGRRALRGPPLRG